MKADKLVDVFKLFLEKYFVSTVLAVIMAFITYYKVPEDNSFLVKFGVVGFSVFSFLIWFVIFEIIKWIFGKIKMAIIPNEDREYINKVNARQGRANMELLWTKIDNMSIYDYKLLKDFLDSGNQPYTSEGYICGDSLLTSDWVHKTVVEAKDKNTYECDRMGMPIGMGIGTRYQYILKDEIYQILKYSLQKYGKISHFNK